jgi:hypothetical protein
MEDRLLDREFARQVLAVAGVDDYRLVETVDESDGD